MSNIIKGHKISWFVYAGTERIPSQKSMRGTWGYDAVCECGWDSKTGGATAVAVGRMVNDHKAEVVTPAPKTTKNVLGLPAKSYEYFVDLAKDAGNWSGQPWLDGNVAAGSSASAMSQTLVRAGLIIVENDGEGAFAIFTPAGIEAAAKVGIDLSWLR